MYGNGSFQCDRGKKLIIAANIKVGQNSSVQQQGIWPAWWTLGESIRHGVDWPKCCEWDILELGNGNSWSQGTCHQEVKGQHFRTDQKIDFNRKQYHTWGVEIDLSSDDNMKQTLNWQLDGKTYFQVKCAGEDADSKACWDRCARSAFFPILNVAVGGIFVGEIGPEMIGGVESGLTVAWVAVFKS
jgi:beta-glucanase (GH16 family)